MGLITGTQVINKAATQLLDAANTRWTRSELMGWMSDGQRQIVQIQPNASATTIAFPLVVGTRQILPADGYLLLDLYRNMGANGTTPGRALRVVSRSVLDGQNPNWHTDTASNIQKNFVYDMQEPRSFYVWPPSDGTNQVELCYSRTPAEITDETQPLLIGDVLQTALLDYVLFRANSKDAEYAPGVELAKMYQESFAQAMGKVAVLEETNNPNQTLGGRNAQPMPGANS